MKPTDSKPLVETSHGWVRGAERTTVYGDRFLCFDGIPYAQPPLGPLRFKAPLPLAEPWEGVRDCTEVAPKSLQYNRYTQQKEGSEDCLYLNVYAKQLPSDRPLPVMVYIHGGGFNTGDATRLSWGPDYFMMRDVVFVTIGARLGPLGFLKFDDPELGVPGNAGLKDIVLGLRWIQQNVSNFGGDPTNVTLFGHSSGSGCAMLLMLAPQCRGLFHKVILMSGFAMHLHRPENLEYRLARELGYQGPKDDRSLYEFLMSLEGEQLVGFDFWTPEERQQGYHYAYAPCLEAYETPEAIVTRHPRELLRSAWSNGLPLMIGCTSFEGLIGYKRYTENPGLYEVQREHGEYLLPRELRQHCVGDEERQRELAAKLVAIHYGDKELGIETAYNAMEMFSYDFIYHSLHRIIQSRLSYSMAPTYLYRFDFDSPTFNLYRIKHCGPDVRGVGHVDDLSYIFYMPQSFKLSPDSAEYRTILRMVDMWTSFAQRTDPNTHSIKPATWKPLERFGARKCLNISDVVSFIEFPEHAKCELWDRVYEEAGLNPH